MKVGNWQLTQLYRQASPLRILLNTFRSKTYMEHDIFFLHFFPAAASKMNYQSYYGVILVLSFDNKSEIERYFSCLFLSWIDECLCKDWLGENSSLWLRKKKSCTVFENYLKSLILKYCMRANSNKVKIYIIWANFGFKNRNMY